MKLTSSDFVHEGLIPSQFTCDGANTPPALQVSGTPTNAKSLVLIMDDPDVPKQVRVEQMFDHWVLFNIPPETTQITPGVGVLGSNTRGDAKYTGPCPPSQFEPTEHRYFFKLYALDIELTLSEGATKVEVEAAMRGHILAQSELMGRYKR